MTDSSETAGSPPEGSWIPAVFFGLVVFAGLMLALYALLWNGGAHT